MKKYLIITTFILSNTYSINAGNAPKMPLKAPIEKKHSNIHLQKITNNSKRNVFVSLERTHIMPLGEPINISGHIMPGKDMEIKDPQGIAEAAMIPVWQKTFRGATINIITLSGFPGRIYYLYAIGNALWAIKAPTKENELKGVHLLNPSDKNRNIELIVHDNNVLEAQVLDENGKPNGEKTKLGYEPTPTVTKESIPEVQKTKRYGP
ncbi:MAG: hypothetical protein WD055_03595 [Candidatus Dependentiae bacterium]